MRLPVFDLDGTLIDSDEALLAAFVALGVARDRVTFGHVLHDECRRLDLDVQEYLDAYDASLACPYPGVDDLLNELSRWAICSNKQAHSATLEVARLGWQPDVALFADSFNGPKRLAPVLAQLGVRSRDVVFVGDTEHDRACAREAGVDFLLAGWNPRAAAVAEPGDVVLAEPSEVLDHLR